MSASNSPAFPLPTPKVARLVRRRLLGWFARHRRDLPWRHSRDPYSIWVSEIMLQQTTVAAVVPFFHRFLNSFPTVVDLAKAEEQDVLRLWEGLGYYRRARGLHQAARLIVAHHAGRMPEDPASWHALPGVGRYTVGAVLSQAFDQRLPIVEANSLRVLCRLFAHPEDPTKGPLKAWLWAAAEALLPRKRVGDFNQSLMELGALVCSPAQPKCPTCPLAGVCQARLLGLQEKIPHKPAEAALVDHWEAAVVIRRGSQVFLVQRPEQGRWANLWEFPHGPLLEKETPKAAAQRLAKELTGFEVEVGGELTTVRHAIMRSRIVMTGFAATHRSGRFRPRSHRRGVWVRPAQLKDYPVSSPQRLLMKAVVAGPEQGWLF